MVPRWVLPLLTVLVACRTAAVEPGPSVPPSTIASVAPAPSAPSPPTVEALVPVLERDARWGNEQAPVTVVLFGSLSDEGSGRSLRQLDALQRELGVDSVRVVWKPLVTPSSAPFRRTEAEVVTGLGVVGGREAVRGLVHLAARSVGNEDTTHAFFLDMSVLVGAVAKSKGDYPREGHVLALTDAIQGLDEAHRSDLKRRVLADEFATAVQEDTALASRLGVGDSPTLFVNGRRLTGLVPRSVLTSVTAEELRRAQELRGQGKSAAEVYALRTRQNADQRQDFPLHRPPLKDGERRRAALGQSPVLGSPAALVTVVAFGGYGENSYRMVQRELLDLQKQHARDVRLVVKSGPSASAGPFESLALDGPLALDTLQVRADKGDQAFWRLHRRLCEESLWHGAEADVESKHPHFTWNEGLILDAVRARSGVPVVEYSAAARQALLADLAQVRALRLESDMVIFLNGRVMKVPDSLDLVGDDQKQKQVILSLRSALAEELAAARRRVADGAKPDQLYETMMASLPEPIED